MADLEKLIETTKKSCFIQLNSDYPDKVNEADVNNVFKYVYNYYLLTNTRPIMNKSDYKTLLLRTRYGVEDFFIRNIDANIQEMSPVDVLIKIFGEKNIDQAIEKYGEKNPITDTTLEEENLPVLINKSGTSLEDIDGGKRKTKKYKKNKNNKKRKTNKQRKSIKK
jgi:hypothetical protein